MKFVTGHFARNKLGNIVKIIDTRYEIVEVDLIGDTTIFKSGAVVLTNKGTLYNDRSTDYDIVEVLSPTSNPELYL